MPELHLDVAVANRFISSLSKSLQALCHGCMEFDSGIELVGYININIDSGSKVDYVLNEKVLKSTTNSMTFVSNSFLAKKEQQKQTRDGACSPIAQLQITPSYASKMRGSHFGSPYQRGASQFPPHSQVMRGPQKRTRTDDWRLSPKKYQSTESSFTSQAVQHSHMMLASSSTTCTDSNFKQVPANLDSGNFGDSTLHLQMNIKTEALETDNQNDLDTEHLGPPNDQKLEPSHEEISKLQVKSDPDEVNSNSEKTAFSDGAVVTEDTDLKGDFLEPNSSDLPQQPTEESSCQSESDNHLPTFVEKSQSGTVKDHTLQDDINMPSTSSFILDESDAGMAAENEPSSDLPIEFDEAAEDGSCTQPGYEDAGEGSSDAGQFEVIEIDDEDEDVQAMFGDHHSAQSSFSQPLDTLRPNHHHHNVVHTSSHSALAARHSRHKEEQDKRNKEEQSYSMLDPGNRMYKCPACGKEYKTSTGARLHYKIKHCGAFDHYCQACGKGFQQKSHLKSHMSLHMQKKDFQCSICGSQYAHKTSLTAHQKLAHGFSL